MHAMKSDMTNVMRQKIIDSLNSIFCTQPVLLDHKSFCTNPCSPGTVNIPCMRLIISTAYSHLFLQQERKLQRVQ